MSIAFTRYKRKFRNNLGPIFAMLQSKKTAMPETEWELLVKKTIHDVTVNPAEYLGPDLPASTLIADALAEIEEEFLKDVRTFR